MIDYLRISSRPFLFTASAVPAAVAAALAAVRICRSAEGPELFARVLDNAAYLHRGLRELGFEVVEPTRLPDGRELVTPIVPVVIGEDWQTAPALEGALGARASTRTSPSTRPCPRGRLADPHERDGDPRARAPRPRAGDLRGGRRQAWRPFAERSRTPDRIAACGPSR